MTVGLESAPVAGRAYRLGVNPVTTTLVLVGPMLIVLIGFAGRNPLTIGLGIAYVLAVPVSVAYFWFGLSESNDHPERSGDDGDEDENHEGSDEDAE